MIANKFIYVYACCVFILFSSFRNDAGVYNIIDFGAKPDGKSINTEAINKAVQSCHDNGGGRVLVPAGTFVSGTVVLLSNVELHFDFGAVLMGSKDTSDYLLQKATLFSEGYNRYGLLYASDAENIAITGFGEINGIGTYFMNGIDKPHLGHDFDRKFTRQKENFMKIGSTFEDGPVSYNFRPGLLITILNCENIHLKDVTLKDAPEWTIRFGDCDKIDVSGITIINNPLIPNNDGIHCTTSSNITISNCKIYTGDDAIIVTGFSDDVKKLNDGSQKKFGNKSGFSENVTVTNCVLSSRSACIRVGYGDQPIRNLVFDNLVMTASNRGIGIFARSNSKIENVSFSNIIINTHIYSGHWWGKGEPIHISALRDNANSPAGTIKDIRFYNITANAETGVVIVGSKSSYIQNITFDGFHLTLHNGKYAKDYGGNFDLRPAYPLDSAIFKHDIPAVYAQFVKGLKFNGLELNWDNNLTDFFTNGVEIDRFENVTITNSVAQPAFVGKSLYGLKLTNGKNAVLAGNNFDTKTTLLKKENVN